MKKSKIFLGIKYACQRMKKGYCEEDVLQIDNWFLGTVPGMLQELSKQSKSFPSAIKDEYYGENNSEEAVPDSLLLHKWKEKLEYMAFLFEEAGKNKDSDDSAKKEYGNKCLDDGFELFVKYFYDLWN